MLNTQVKLMHQNSVWKLKIPFISPIKTIKLLGYLLCLLPLLVSGQTGLWQTVNNAPISLGVPSIAPQKYLILKLDTKMMQGFLSNAPMEMTSAIQNSNTVIDIPMPDGKMQRFMIVESPVMELGLAQKFPDIKTYSGYSLENQATSIRLDFTPAGFHAMILSPTGTFFIDPFSKGTIDYYISYDKKDYVSNNAFTCSVGDPEIGPTKKEKKTDEELPKLDFPAKQSARFGDGVLRTYRLALAATGEYTKIHGGTVPGALVAQAITINRVNGIFLRDLSVKLIIIANNDLLIYTDPTTDPYTIDNGNAMLSENVANLDAVIKPANYDIGHVFSTGGGGIATKGSVCNSSSKARGVTGLSSPEGDVFDVDFVAHEMGHQFGGSHTFNNSCANNRNTDTAFEPGSGTTIMGYANNCLPGAQRRGDDYFHGGSLSEIHTFIVGAGNACASKPRYSNTPPVINSYTPSQTIPKGTPILLTGSATDADGNNSLTYCWEQMDAEIGVQPPVSTATGGPVFRSFAPTFSNTRYIPKLTDLVNNTTPMWEVLPQVARTLKFRLVVRDNTAGGGSNDHADITLTVDQYSGPLLVTMPNATGIIWTANSTTTVTWNKANTHIAPISCSTVDILLSTDGGLTYPVTIATNVPNTGSASITVPEVFTNTARIMVRGSGRAFFDISDNNFSISNGCVSAMNSSRCDTGTITLTATGCTGGKINWYANASDGSLLGTGGTFITPSITTTTTYFVGCTLPACLDNRTPVIATINNSIPLITTGGTRCGTGTVVLKADGCDGGTIEWYDGISGGSVIGVGNSFLTSILEEKSTYYVSCRPSNCPPTNRVPVVANVNKCEYCPAGIRQDCSDNDVITNVRILYGRDSLLNQASGCSSNGYFLYTALPIPNLETGKTYTFIVNNPNLYPEGAAAWIDYNHDGIFEANELIFSKESSRWFNAGNDFIIPTNINPGETRMRVKLVYNRTPASACAESTANYGETEDYVLNIVNNCDIIPPIGTDASRCGEGTIKLAASGCAGGTITWYNSISGGVSIASGTSFTTPDLTSSKTYYVDCTIGDCVSSRVPVTATITSTIDPPTPSGNSNCGAGTVVLTATGCSEGAINWYQAISGGTSLGTGTSFTTPGLSTTTNYYVGCTIGTCISERAVVAATITPSIAPPTLVTGASRCNVGSVTLTASGCKNGVIKWYNSASGGSAIGTGTSFNTPQITATTNYYVSCVVDGCSPVVFTQKVSEVNASSAKIQGLIQNYKTGNVTSYGVCYTLAPGQPTINSNKLEFFRETNPSNAKSFEALLSSLISDTTYHVRAYAIRGEEVIYGEVLAFTTEELPISSFTSWTGTATGLPPLQANITVNSTATVSIVGNRLTIDFYNGPYPNNGIIVHGYLWATITPLTEGQTSLTFHVYDLPEYVWTMTGTTLTGFGGSEPGSGNTSGILQTRFNYSLSMPSLTSLVPVLVEEECSTGSCSSSRIPVTATITVIPGPTPATASRCGDGSVTLTATGCSGAINWYTAMTGGASIATGGSYTTPSLTSTTTYYADCTIGNCSSSRVAVAATITTPPNPPTPTPASRCGVGSVTLTATGCTDGTINWYTAMTGGSSIATGTSYNTPTISNTITYYVGCTVGTCPSARVAVLTTITTPPNPPTPIPASRCGAGSVPLTATGCTSGIINWYTVSSGGASIATGINYNTPTISNTITYYADCTVDNCPSTRMAVVATINTSPNPPTPIGASRCGTGSVTLTATGCTNGTINWYTISSGGTSIATGGSYITPNISTTTTYYAGCTVGICPSTRMAVLATIITLPNPPTPIGTNRCGTGSVTLTATGCTDGIIYWYTVSSGGTSIATGTSYNTPTISATTTYYAGCTVGNCSSNRVAVSATIITPPNAPTPLSANRCGTGSVTLTVTGCTGAINWYTAISGGASIAIGTSYNTPILTATTTYYASCTVNNCASTRVGVTATILINAIFSGDQSTGVYRASNTIISTANVASGTNYYGVKSILLNPGFQAGGQEVFLAKIEQCPQ